MAIESADFILVGVFVFPRGDCEAPFMATAMSQQAQLANEEQTGIKFGDWN